MITIIALLLIVGTFILIIRECEFMGRIEFWFGILIATLISGIIIFITASLGISMNGVECSRESKMQRIYSLKIENGANGKFSLGSGYINGQEYYYSFTKNIDGGFDRLKLSANSCRLFLDEDVQPYMSWQKINYRPSKWFNAIPLFDYRFSEDSMYYLHVPTNTIVEKYEVR